MMALSTGFQLVKSPFNDGDLVTVDVGVFYKGYHTDAAFSKVVGTSTPTKDRFLKAGMEGLKNAIDAVKPGNRIGDISEAMESTLKKYGYRATRELTGHGVGQGTPRRTNDFQRRSRTSRKNSYN